MHCFVCGFTIFLAAFVKDVIRYRTGSKLSFGCLLLEKSILKGQVMVGKERLLYSGSWQPGKIVDSCLKDHLHCPGEAGEF